MFFLEKYGKLYQPETTEEDISKVLDDPDEDSSLKQLA